MTIRISEQGVEWIDEDDGCVFRGNKMVRIRRDKKTTRTNSLLNSSVSGRTFFSNRLSQTIK